MSRAITAAARTVRKSDLGRVLDVLAARGWTPHAVRVNPDGSVDLADAPLDAPAPTPANVPNEWE
jgi:hypothetical protein